MAQHEEPIPEFASQDGETVDALWSTTYAELKQLARARLRHGEGRSDFLDTTALVNESYLRLVAQSQFKIADRRQFFAYVSRVMRSVVVDLVRERLALRRGGDLERVALSNTLLDHNAQDEPLRVDDALRHLRTLEPRLVQVVEMRYFAGLNDAEIADVLGVSLRTVGRDWEKARLLLRDMLDA